MFTQLHAANRQAHTNLLAIPKCALQVLCCRESPQSSAACIFQSTAATFAQALHYSSEMRSKESSSAANMQTMTYAISSFCFPFSFPVDVEAIGIGGISISLASELLSKSKNPSSSKILVPSFSAFSVLDGPASRPFRKYDVLPLTPVVTRLC